VRKGTDKGKIRKPNHTPEGTQELEKDHTRYEKKEKEVGVYGDAKKFSKRIPKGIKKRMIREKKVETKEGKEKSRKISRKGGGGAGV